jgi:CubicO group peptidase (beta-lactamase class C family)
MRRAAVPILVALCLLTRISAQPADQAALASDIRSRIDQAAAEVLEKTGAPSASIAIVRDGQLAYAHAYGLATVESKTAATPRMRYSIGSISKQFTASAILRLAEQGKLSLDDPVARFLPDLTRARDVTLRQLLSMTSGYQDFWPQDYVMPPMLKSVTPDAILAEWGRKPLDFEPGTRWQYSNTNYVIAGVIVERVTGTPFFELLTKTIFQPLGMASVFDTDARPLGPEDPSRYRRFALGPPRPAPKEGRGWMFAAGELAMTASDLARWNISVIDRAVLRRESYEALETEVRLTSGVGTGYGLGVSVGLRNGRRLVSHSGEVSGFTARNDVFPDDRLAVSVLVNLDATDASGQLADRIGTLLFEAQDPERSQILDRARTVFTSLQQGKIDRSLFTANANAYFIEQALRDHADSLGPLGAPEEFTPQSESLRGGMTFRSYRVRCGGRTLRVTTFTTPAQKLEQYIVAGVD